MHQNVKSIKEGEAEILVNDTSVFYNPVQEFNRDLSIAVLATYIKNISKQVTETNAKKKMKSVYWKLYLQLVYVVFGMPKK